MTDMRRRLLWIPLALAAACGGSDSGTSTVSTASAFVSGDEDRLYTDGMLAWRNGDVAQAEADFRGSLQANPRYLAAHISLGNLLVDVGRPAESLPSFDEAVRLRERSIDAHLGRARALHDLDDLAGARQAADTAVALATDAHVTIAAEAQVVRGGILEDAGDAEGAVSAYERALQLDAGATEARIGLAHLYADQDRMADAVRVLGRAGQYETDGLRLLEVGRTFHHFGLHDRAIEVLEAAHASLPDNQDILFYYASSAVRSGRDDLGIELATNLIARNSSYFPAYTVRGEANLGRGYTHNARTDAQVVLTQDANNYDALVLLGDIEAADNAIEAAATYYDRARTVDPDNVRAIDHMATLLFDQRDYNAYVGLIEPVLGRPDRPEQWLGQLILALQRAGREAEAVVYQSELSVSRPSDHLLNYQVAAAALAHPDQIPAEQVLYHARQAVEHIGGAPLNYRVVLIDALLLNGRASDARAVLERAEELFPNAVELNLRRDRVR